MTTLRTATYRKPRMVRTVTLEDVRESESWNRMGVKYFVGVRKGTGRTCWAGTASTLTEAVAEFRRAIEWLTSEGLALTPESILDDHEEALEAFKAWLDARERALVATTWTIEYAWRYGGTTVLQSVTTFDGVTPEDALARYLARHWAGTENETTLVRASAYQEGSVVGWANWKSGEPFPPVPVPARL